MVALRLSCVGKLHYFQRVLRFFPISLSFVNGKIACFPPMRSALRTANKQRRSIFYKDLQN
ncbi:MAG: hypothetical protein EAZ95_12800 [Bacteroidetes bacterium]|nr:MAG: hypothetical protein EAZ95_12800 [Bacteroidota bacterium]